eukprot:15482848-Alexandrium_andersonii.AAC.1
MEISAGLSRAIAAKKRWAPPLECHRWKRPCATNAPPTRECSEKAMLRRLGGTDLRRPQPLGLALPTNAATARLLPAAPL